MDRSATVVALREQRAAHTGHAVMIGGDVLGMRPMPAETEIEILTKPLGSEDGPHGGDTSDGRALIRRKQFLHPAVCTEGVRRGGGRVLGRAALHFPTITDEKVAGLR